jgi:enoyl-CoA hydratase
MSNEDVLFRVERRLGRIILNRPSALNALTLDMIRAIAATLDRWESDIDICAVAINGEGPRAFCAGGDVVAIYDAGIAGNFAEALTFWAEEYALNDRIASYSRPVIALIHGFCMGGGVGLACHASHRVVGETARIAMPECALGLVPDVGGTALLTRAPAGIGPWMALTGARLGPAEAIKAGFASHFVPEQDWASLRAELAATGNAQSVLAFENSPPPMQWPDATLLDAFLQPGLPDVLAALRDLATDAAQRAIDGILKGSPLAMQMALRMQQMLAPQDDLRTALRLEYRAVRHVLIKGDFLEGIRARIIDRDNSPRWQHGLETRISAAEIDAYLDPRPGEELVFPSQTAGAGRVQ